LMRGAAQTATAVFPLTLRSALYTAAKAALAALVICIVVGWVDATRLAPAFTAADPTLLAIAVALSAPNLWLQYSKWRTLVRRVRPETDNRRIAASLFTGFALGLVTPARTGEYGGRAIAMPGSGAAVLAGLTAVDKMAALVVTVACGCVATAALLAHGPGGGPALPAALLGGIAVLLLFAALIKGRKPFERMLLRRIPRSGRWGAAAHRVLQALSELQPRDLRALIWKSAAFYAVFISQFALFLIAQERINPFDALCGASAVMLLKTVVPPVTFGELGIREGASVLVFALLGVPGATAFNASILLFIVNVLLPALAGTVLLLLPALARPQNA